MSPTHHKLKSHCQTTRALRARHKHVRDTNETSVIEIQTGTRPSAVIQNSQDGNKKSACSGASWRLSVTYTPCDRHGRGRPSPCSRKSVASWPCISHCSTGQGSASKPPSSSHYIFQTCLTTSHSAAVPYLSWPRTGKANSSI
jgi:hypothetical protein